jgi:hypothetical protein
MDYGGNYINHIEHYRIKDYPIDLGIGRSGLCGYEETNFVEMAVCKNKSNGK